MTTESTTVPVERETLDGWRAACHRTHQNALSVASLVLKNQWREARERAKDVAETVRRMGVSLDQAGARRPAEMPAPPTLPDALRDTPATRRYLAALREAHAAALDMDAERKDEDGPEAQMVELLIRDAEGRIAAARPSGPPVILRRGEAAPR